MDDPGSFDLDAAGLRADGSDVAAQVEVLAGKLQDALPAATSVQRRSKGLLSREKVVEAIDVRMGCARALEVRGVVIRREELGLQDWLDALTAELREAAASSAEARSALDRLLG